MLGCRCEGFRRKESSYLLYRDSWLQLDFLGTWVNLAPD
jgi:hypothetical protein